MKLMQKLPPEAYNSERHVQVFQDAINAQIMEVQAARDDFKRQCNPLTATWGMEKYEQEVGIPVDESKPIDQRRSAYIAKRRGVGTTTTEVIKRIAESFYNGEVEVIEHKKEFWIEIIFKSLSGVPPNMEDLKAAIEDVIPAHMEPVYLILFNTYEFLSQFTYKQLSNFTYKELREKKIRFNTYADLKKFTYAQLSKLTYKQIMTEELPNE